MPFSHDKDWSVDVSCIRLKTSGHPPPREATEESPKELRFSHVEQAQVIHVCRILTRHPSHHGMAKSSKSSKRSTLEMICLSIAPKKTHPDPVVQSVSRTLPSEA